MPRVTPLRVLKVLLLPWLIALGLWLFLPSPMIKPTLRRHYIESILTRAKTLTTIHPTYSASRSETAIDLRYSQSYTGEESGCIIDWRLSSKRDSLTLHIGDVASVNLTQTLLHAVKPNSNGTFAPYLTGAMEVKAKLGSTSDSFSFPWFAWSDKVMFDWINHDFDYYFKVRMYVPSPGVVEVWKDMPELRALPAVKLSPEVRDQGLMVSLQGLSTDEIVRGDIKRVVIREMKGVLLSRTYSIRRFVMLPVILLMMAIFIVFDFILVPFVIPLSIAAAAYMFIVAVAWLNDGRPKFRKWCAGFWMTRCWVTTDEGDEGRVQLWGPGGPILSHDGGDSDEVDEYRLGIDGQVTDIEGKVLAEKPRASWFGRLGRSGRKNGRFNFSR